MKNILSKLGATKRINIAAGCNSVTETYSNNIEITMNFINLEKTEIEVYKNDKLIFVYQYTKAEYNSMLDAFNRVSIEILTPCKASKNKIQKLSQMTIENGCTAAEVLTAKILMNKLILRSQLN